MSSKIDFLSYFPHCSIKVKNSGLNSYNTYKLRFSISCLAINELSSPVSSKEDGDGVKREQDKSFFWNQTFDKGRLKIFVLWFLAKHGEDKTIKLVEELKNVGFDYATKAGISLGIEDLKIPKKKYSMMMDAETLSNLTIKQYKRNEITAVEKYQRLIETWHRVSETLKQEVIVNFETTDILNPVYMMAFSGARGNISQVRQLVGMRGLMSSPTGQIIDFPIRSNFREGLTLTEYIISSYGARKGIVDTALRTANAGYLTRRLVDVAQHVIISNFDCGTKRGIFLTDMKEGNKVIYSLQNRLIGRFLARDVINKQNKKIAHRNTEISVELSNLIGQNSSKVFVRSSLTCETKKLVCQLCYGWSLAQGNLVSIGEAIGVIAAQSIGEPGTQLTMRTFHTGGVFSGDMTDQIKAPFSGTVIYPHPIAGTLIRTPDGKIAFLTKNEGSFILIPSFASPLKGMGDGETGTKMDKNEIKKYKIPFYTLLFLKNGEIALEKDVIAQISYINRQKIATDYSQLTIKADFSGQFYSKMLNLKENKVGPKLKESDDTTVDFLFESWGWGYAWILSGKIYQLNLPGLFFPIFGDYLNQTSFLNKIEWTTPSNFSGNLKLNLNSNMSFFNQNLKQFRSISKKNKHLTIQKNIEKESYKLNFLNQTNLSFLKNQLMLVELSKIIFKKIGYFLELNTSNNLGESFMGSSLKNPSIITSNDTLLLLSPLKKDQIKKNFLDFSSNMIAPLIQRTEILNEKKVTNFTYPSRWRKSFNLLLNWFPKRSSTHTGGLAYFEPIIFGSLLPLQSNYLFKQKVSLIQKLNFFQDQQTNLLSNSVLGESILSLKVSEKNEQLSKINKNLNYFPTLIGRNYLKNKMIQVLSVNRTKSLESPLTRSPQFTLLAKEKKINSKTALNPMQSAPNQTFLMSSAQVKFKNATKFIFEQSHENNFGIIFYTSENLSKKKAKIDILNIGLPFKNCYRINSTFFLETPNLYKNIQKETQTIKESRLTKDIFKFQFALASKVSNNLNKNEHFKRILWIAQPFFNFNISITNNLLLNFSNNKFSSRNTENYTKIKTIHSNSEYSTGNKTLIQVNRQGKLKNLNLLPFSLPFRVSVSHPPKGEIAKTGETAIDKNKSASISNQIKSHFQFNQISSFNVFSNQSTTTERSDLHFSKTTCLDDNFLAMHPHPLSGEMAEEQIFVLSKNNVKTELKKIYQLNQSFSKEGIFSFNSFEKNIFKKLNIRNNILLPLNKKTTFKSNKLRVTTLQNFSKLNSFPYFLSDKNYEFFQKNLNKVELTKENSLKKNLFLQYFFNLLIKNLTKTNSKIFNPHFLLKVIRLKNKLLILKDTKSENLYKSRNVFSKPPNFKQLLNLNIEKSKIIKINNCFYVKKKESPIWQNKIKLGILTLVNKSKIETVFSPYLKDQFKFFFKINKLSIRSAAENNNLVHLASITSLLQISKTKIISDMPPKPSKEEKALNLFPMIYSTITAISLEKVIPVPALISPKEETGDGKDINQKSYLLKLLNTKSLFFNDFNSEIKTQLNNWKLERKIKLKIWLKKSKYLKYDSILNYSTFNSLNFNHLKYFLSEKKEEKKRNYQNYFNTFNIFKNKQNLIVNNLVFKPGWTYFTNNLDDFLYDSYKLLNPGKDLFNQFIFDNHFIYIEVIKLNKSNISNLKKKLISSLFNLRIEVLLPFSPSPVSTFHPHPSISPVSSKEDGEIAETGETREGSRLSSIVNYFASSIPTSKTNPQFIIKSSLLNDVQINSKLISPLLNKEDNTSINIKFKFNNIIENSNSRFKKEKTIKNFAKSNHNYCILIRKGINFELFKKADYKKEIQNISTASKNCFNLKKVKTMQNRRNYIGKSYNSLECYLAYKTRAFNKQKITSRVLSKHSSSEISVVLNTNIYDFLSKSGSDPNLILSDDQATIDRQEKVIEDNTSSRLSSKLILKSSISQQMNNYLKKEKNSHSIYQTSFLTSIRANNFFPLILSYQSPYSNKFPFKKLSINFSHPQHPRIYQASVSLKTAKKDKQLENDNCLANSNSFSFYLKTILSTYLFRINFSRKANSFKSISTLPFNNFKLENQSKSSLPQAVSILSNFLLSPILEYNLNQTLDKSIFYPNTLIVNQLKTPSIWNLNNIYNKKYLSKFKPYILGTLNKGYKLFTNSTLNKEAFFYKGSFSTFPNNQIISSIPFLNTYSYSPFEGEFVYKNSKGYDYLSQNKIQNINKLSSALSQNNNLENSCMILTKSDLVSYSFSLFSFKETFFTLESLKRKNCYFIDNMIIQYVETNINSSDQAEKYKIKLSEIPSGLATQTNKMLLGHFLLYGDQIGSFSKIEQKSQVINVSKTITEPIAIEKSGQIIHLNNKKITLRKGQPIFISPQAILYKSNGDFINEYESAITLSYQQLKTGDIIQGIPKVEQFFEARTTKTGRLFKESLANLLKLTFKSYKSKLPLNQAVRQSFYKIQQIIIDGVHRVYRSQGVSITDKHLEVIVKQMTSKVRILEGGQTGFFSGEIIDLQFVEHVNSLLLKQISYEPIVLGITKASLEVDSFLSAASFQQTTKVLSRSALYRKNDFLKGLKENVIMGNLIPAGTGYLVYLGQH